MKQPLVAVIALLLLAPGLPPASVRADTKSKVSREVADYVLQKFGKEAAEHSAESLARRIELLAVKHGDEALEAVKKVGPRAFRLVEEAGEQGTNCVKLMARFGDDAAVWVISRPQGMALFAKYGEGAAEALVKHKGIAEPIIEGFGDPAIHALGKVNPQNGRRLAMMLEEGELKAIGRTPEVLEVVAKYGDGAMDFIWRNKSSLAVAAGLTAFLADPKPFIDGATDIAKTVGENAVKPLANVPGQVAAEAAKQTNWTAVAICAVAVSGVLVGVKMWSRRRKTRQDAETSTITFGSR